MDNAVDLPEDGAAAKASAVERGAAGKCHLGLAKASADTERKHGAGVQEQSAIPVDSVEPLGAKDCAFWGAQKLPGKIRADGVLPLREQGLRPMLRDVRGHECFSGAPWSKGPGNVAFEDFFNIGLDPTAQGFLKMVAQPYQRAF